MSITAARIIEDALAAGRRSATLPAGIYREKLAVECEGLSLCGEGADSTIISWNDCAKMHDTDENMLGTFRSYTAFFRAERLHMSDLTVENTAGQGDVVGQAVAAYFDCREAYIERCRFLGHQDTVFTAPLPERPVIPNSFRGPNEGRERLPSLLYFSDCLIEGDIDFIFGGATAVFENCEIRSLDRGQRVNGWCAAPSTDADARWGYVFLGCRFTGECAPGTVFIARPWRKDGSCTLIDCELGNHISPLGWDDWGSEEKRRCARFSESGGGAVEGRVPWAKRLTEGERAECLAFCEETKRRLSAIE